MPGSFEDVQALTPFGTVYRYDDLPLDDTPDRVSAGPLPLLMRQMSGLTAAS
jgi:hypothetical protein